MSAAGGRNVVISGGGTGIGRAIAKNFAGAGDRVVVVGRRRGALETVATANDNVIPLVCDVTAPDQLRGLAAELQTQLGVLDVVVANAGGGHDSPLDSLEDVAEHWSLSLQQNLLSAVLFEYALRPLLRRPGGRFIAISSASAHGGGEVAYASSKAAMNRWIVQVATDLGREGITANCVSPGFVPDTELYGGGVVESMQATIAKGIAVGRAGSPADIAAAVAYIASPQAGFVSGSVLEIHGGRRTFSASLSTPRSDTPTPLP